MGRVVALTRQGGRERIVFKEANMDQQTTIIFSIAGAALGVLGGIVGTYTLGG
jgi:hypothetical protein